MSLIACKCISILPYAKMDAICDGADSSIFYCWGSTWYLSA